MADETAKGTEYRVLKRVEAVELDPNDGTLITGGDEAMTLPEGTVLFALLPGTFTGNVRKAAHEAAGDGDYAKVAARSFDEFPARATTVVRFS